MTGMESAPAGSNDISDTRRRPTCRHCAAELAHIFVDLGMSPLCQTQISEDRLNHMEPFYPLRVHVCSRCLLVQLEEYVAPGIIFAADYPYYSSYSDSWVEHARQYVEHMSRDFGVGKGHFVVEIASNDGYLLQHFIARGVHCLGIEPAEGVAAAARAKGVPTQVQFFSEKTAADVRSSEGSADLIIGNNVLAHVPNLNDFVSGVRELLGAGGLATFEFPHLVKLIEQNQFDTIYHEHFSYFSFGTVSRVFESHGLRVFDVRELPTHGGSLRLYACHAGDERRRTQDRVQRLLDSERQAGYDRLETYFGFAKRVEQTKRKLLSFLIEAKNAGKSVAGYGAPGKGNTLLNYCGIRQDFLDYTVDRNPHKQGTYTPGTRIPIHHPDRIFETRPDYVLVLPWNLADEITQALAGIGRWGGRCVVPIPELRVIA